MESPILVMGVGRSGTSTVARLLHTEFDICMGKDFREPDEQNPRGYYEALDLKSLNQQFIEGVLTFGCWFTAVENALATRSASIRWGFKDPRLCELGGVYFSLIPSPYIIRCRRSSDLVIKSICRCYGATEGEAVAMVERRERMLDNLLCKYAVLNDHYLEIDFTKHASDRYLKEVLARSL